MPSIRKVLMPPIATLVLAACSTASGYNHGDDKGSMDGSGSTAGPGGDYQMVSKLVELPDFIPGMGRLYVQPDTLPAGPFLAYDRDGDHVSTIYMIPLDEMNDQSKWTNLEAGGKPVRSVDVTYNPGHPGVNEPHYHFTVWHVAKSEAALGK